MTARLTAFALILATLGACSSPIDLPPARSLQTSAEQLAVLPGYRPGPYALDSFAAQDWPTSPRPLRLRILAARGAGPYPLLLFSHGFASDEAQYDALLRHWASHGFVIIAPAHRDSGGTMRAILASLRLGKMGLIRSRVEDMQAVLDQLPALADIDPALPARIDAQRIAIAGHSFGAFTAQQFAGAQAIDPDSGERSGAADPRVKAVVAISPPGEMFGLINARSWRDMRLPVLATTGTWDVDGRFVTDWRQHRLSFDSAPPGDKSLLVIEGADHYFGNLICRLQREATPQHEALQLTNAVAVDFLSRHLLGTGGKRTGEPAPTLEALTGGFARIERR